MTEASGDNLFLTAQLNNDPESYHKAGVHFKLAKCNNKATSSFILAAEIWLLDDVTKYQAATDFQAAATLSEPEQSLLLYQRSADLFMDRCRISKVAKIYAEMGHIQKKLFNFEEAINCYEKSCDYYEAENCPATGISILLEAAYICITELKDFARSFVMIEKCIAHCINESASKFRCKELVFDLFIISIFLEKDLKSFVVKYGEEINKIHNCEVIYFLSELSKSGMSNVDISKTLQLKENSWQYNLLTSIFR